MFFRILYLALLLLWTLYYVGYPVETILTMSLNETIQQIGNYSYTFKITFSSVFWYILLTAIWTGIYEELTGIDGYLITYKRNL